MAALSRKVGLWYAVATATLAIITWADAVTGVELSLFVFYFVPVSIAAWFVGRRAGLAFAFAAAACWQLAERYSSASIAPFYLWWDTAMQLTAYAIIALAVSELHAYMRRQHDLLRAVSHDLRAPLTALVGHAHLLGKQSEPGSWVAVRAEAIQRVAQRMNAMIEELVEAGRGRRPRLELRPVELGPFLRELLARMSASLPVQRVRVVGAEAGVAALADPPRLERIVVNLVSNALRYAGDGTPVELVVEPHASRIVLSVVDHGPGIAPEEREHLFERYYRGRASAGTDGLGLGLHSTRLLVQAHHGRIAVDAPPGGGAAFRVELVRAEVAAAPAPQPGSPASD
jgi:signal transduction histidine kinase